VKKLLASDPAVTHQRLTASQERSQTREARLDQKSEQTMRKASDAIAAADRYCEKYPPVVTPHGGGEGALGVYLYAGVKAGAIALWGQGQKAVAGTHHAAAKVKGWAVNENAKRLGGIDPSETEGLTSSRS
jgi:hypothetical protein